MPTKKINLLGFMQGRLCNCVDGKIQAFPWRDWKKEFIYASEIDFPLMEWTLDNENLYKNPLMTAEGRSEITTLSKQYNVSILSLTGDCFMQEPFWKKIGNDREKYRNDFLAVIISCSSLGIENVVLPLVDNGSLKNSSEEDILVEFLNLNAKFFQEKNVKIVIESDYEPKKLDRFLLKIKTDQVGINYDIGNSASLGFDPLEEFGLYGDRILNIHIKDRLRGGGTVPLGRGNADFDRVFEQIARSGYKGNFIIQAARDDAGEHLKLMQIYKKFIINYMQKHGLMLG